MPPQPPQPTFLIWGANGWIAGMLHTLLLQQGKTVHTTSVPMHEQSLVRAELDRIKPTHVLNCAGKTGRPNVDWCETHKLETMEANGLGTFVLTHECAKRGVHCTVLATGCIYTSTYSADYTKVLSEPFKETDTPNFTGSFYSLTKAPIETFLRHHPRTLILRLRMPVTATLSPRSFVTKILTYRKVVSIPNSHSILPTLLPVIVAMAEHNEEGVYNFTNPGAISHNEVLEMYRRYVEPGRRWENFTLEEQSRVIVAERSNCVLDVGKLVGKVEEYRKEGMVGLEVPEIREAYRRCFVEMAEGIKRDGGLQVLGGAVRNGDSAGVLLGACGES